MTPMPAKRSKLTLTTAAFAVTFVALGSASALVGGDVESNAWYQTLTLPRLQPPGALFGIAWTILYSLMGAAVARLWLSPKTSARTLALWLFALQFCLNLGWNPLFFAGQQIFPALLLLLAIYAAALATTLAAGRVDRPAAWMLVPYLVWLGFAFGLNWRIWMANPGA